MNLEEFNEFADSFNYESYWNNNESKINNDFQFKDLELGDIYIFTTPYFEDDDAFWVMMPIQINSETDYTVYWRYYRYGYASEATEERCRKWATHLWVNKNWLKVTPSQDILLINWRKDPFEVKS